MTDPLSNPHALRLEQLATRNLELQHQLNTTETRLANARAWLNILLAGNYNADHDDLIELGALLHAH